MQGNGCNLSPLPARNPSSQAREGCSHAASTEQDRATASTNPSSLATERCSHAPRIGSPLHRKPTTSEAHYIGSPLPWKHTTTASTDPSNLAKGQPVTGEPQTMLMGPTRLLDVRKNGTFPRVYPGETDVSRDRGTRARVQQSVYTNS